MLKLKSWDSERISPNFHSFRMNNSSRSTVYDGPRLPLGVNNFIRIFTVFSLTTFIRYMWMSFVLVTPILWAMKNCRKRLTLFYIFFVTLSLSLNSVFSSHGFFSQRRISRRLRELVLSKKKTRCGGEQKALLATKSSNETKDIVVM